MLRAVASALRGGGACGLMVLALARSSTGETSLHVPCFSGDKPCSYPRIGTNNSGCCPLADSEAVCCHTPLPTSGTAGGIAMAYCCPKSSGCSTRASYLCGPKQGSNCSVAAVCSSGPADWTTGAGSRRRYFHSAAPPSRIRCFNSDGERARVSKMTVSPIWLNLGAGERKAAVLVIGDSVSDGWTPVLAGLLNQTHVTVHSPGKIIGGGARSTSNFLLCSRYMLHTDELRPLPLKSGDIVLVNFGLQEDPRFPMIHAISSAPRELPSTSARGACTRDGALAALRFTSFRSNIAKIVAHAALNFSRLRVSRVFSGTTSTSAPQASLNTPRSSPRFCVSRNLRCLLARSLSSLAPPPPTTQVQLTTTSWSLVSSRHIFCELSGNGLSLVCSFTDSDSGGHIAAINAAAKAVCSKSGIQFVDLHTPLIAACGAVPWADKGAAACKLCAPSCKRLSVHYIATGYEFIARIVAQAAGLIISTQWKTDDQYGVTMGARSLTEAFRLIEEQGRQIGALPGPPPPPPPPPLCAAKGGVVFVDECGDGFNATDSAGQPDHTTVIQAALNVSGAHTVVLRNLSASTPWVVTPLFIHRNDMTFQFEPNAFLHAKRGRACRAAGANTCFWGTNDCMVKVTATQNVSIVGGSGSTIRMCE